MKISFSLIELKDSSTVPNNLPLIVLILKLKSQ